MACHAVYCTKMTYSSILKVGNKLGLHLDERSDARRVGQDGKPALHSDVCVCTESAGGW